MDLDDGFLFVMVANDIQDAQHQLPNELSKTFAENHTDAVFDGSYHYYPLLVGESDTEAEKRIFLLTAKRYGVGCILVRQEIRDSIGRGTWCSGLQSNLKKMLHGSMGNLDDSSSVSVASIGGADKDAVFSMSI